MVHVPELTPFLYFARLLKAQQPMEVRRMPAVKCAYNLLDVISGTASILRAGEQVDLRPGHVALLQPGDSFLSSVAFRCRQAAFDLQHRARHVYHDHVAIDESLAPQPSLESIFKVNVPLVLPDNRVHEARSLLLHAESDYWRSGNAQCACAQQIALLVAHLADDQQITMAGDGATERQAEDLAGRVMDYIRMHYRDHLTVDELAGQFGVTSRYLQMLFAERCGCGPGELLRHQRIDKAKKKLKSSQASIADIARKVGYRNTQSFSRAFLKMTGMSPSQWRRNGEV